MDTRRIARFLASLPERRLSRRAALRAGTVGLGTAGLSLAGVGIAGLSAEQPATPSPEAATSAAGMAGMTGTATLAPSGVTPVPSPTAMPPQVFTPEAIIPATVETWTEPWIWRPSQWPGQQLNLNLVENVNPGAIVGNGNSTAILFAYGGSTPGPTIRMRGDEVLLVRLRNLLGQDQGTTPFGPYPDFAALPKNLTADQVNAKLAQLGQIQADFCLGEHVNGIHTIHDTNLHTHGLHVRPGRNPDGTHSDNILLRLINQQDFAVREAHADSATCDWLRAPEQTSALQEDEIVGFADFEFHVGNVQADARAAARQPAQPHPPGTFWYHPHCHGATHIQVASGMAGFLIVEGDVDDAINLALTGSRQPDPQVKTGPYDYIERAMLIQRVFTVSKDPDAATNSLLMGGNANTAVNGDQDPATIVMRPGAIERWRVLNGSVDGQGYVRFMVVKGQYAVEESLSPNGNILSRLVKLRDATHSYTPVTRAEVAADKQQVYLLAIDGVTLVDTAGDKPVHAIRDLAAQNGGTANPLDGDLGNKPNEAMLANFEASFKDATSIRNAFVRPNEVLMAQGNRADVFFQAPRLATSGTPAPKAEIYTVLARSAVLNSDNYQQTLQKSYTAGKLAQAPEDTVVAWVIVSDDDPDAPTSTPIPAYNVLDLNKVMPPVPDYLLPITDEDVQIKPAANGRAADPDAAIAGRAGKYRTRTIAYSGWGANDFPLVTTVGDSETAKNFRAFIQRDQATGSKLASLRYVEIANSKDHLLLPPGTRTMAISTALSDEVIDGSDPLFPITAGMGRKFMPDDPRRGRMLLDTAEEWTVYNYSISLWANTETKPAGQYGAHYPGLPLLRGDGQARFAAQPPDGKTWQLTTQGVDHPFHMHQNPFWVMRVEIPDEQGNLVNILDQPQWQDVVWVPRNGGRVVFRSRFPDYVGAFVNHCHILMHEDNGMMQVVQITPFADQANYEPKAKVARTADTADAITAVYPRLDQAGAWLQAMRFIDPSPAAGQTFPGFVVAPPTE